jgi:LuxR family quorum sensing-dependent transcriptional regulator
MVIASGMFALSESFRGMTSGTQVLDALEGQFRALGTTHFLATGRPFPGRPIEPLVLRMNWGDHRPGLGLIDTKDSVLSAAFSGHRPQMLVDAHESRLQGDSPLLGNLAQAGQFRLISVPICAFLPYQGVVLAGGTTLSLDSRAVMASEHLCTEAFRRLFALGFLRPERPGELSARERRVVELSASGKTASDIASILDISQRTVHAHLQNASEKLRASNKTHTVVEALRYGQISV